jgi:hypothetical protein
VTFDIQEGEGKPVADAVSALDAELAKPEPRALGGAVPVAGAKLEKLGRPPAPPPPSAPGDGGEEEEEETVEEMVARLQESRQVGPRSLRH